MPRENISYALGATQFVVAPGNTLAFFVTPEVGEASHSLSVLSGGSLEIQRPPLTYQGYDPGATWLGASLAGFVLGSGQPVAYGAAYNIDGPAKYYLMATGATTTVVKLISYTQGSA